MKFPLYNECPNCGHKATKHDRDGCWGGGYDTEKSSNVFILHCACPLLGPEVNNAISIQAAIEVALQRAGVGDRVSHSRVDYPIIKNMPGKGQIFGTSAQVENVGSFGLSKSEIYRELAKMLTPGLIDGAQLKIKLEAAADKADKDLEDDMFR